MRLIDADALKEKRTCLWDPALGYCACVLIEDIDAAPTITPEDCRPHGRWEFDSYTAKYGNPYRCSQFKEEYDDTHNYCPHCGAKMDLEGTA